MSQTNRAALGMMLLALSGVIADAQLTSQAEATAYSYVVMVKSGGECGGGVIVGYDDKDIYIATAAHIGELYKVPDQKVEVAFINFEDKPWTAGVRNIDPPNQNQGDLAVLTVTRDATLSEVLSKLNFEVRSPVALPPLNTPMHSIGCSGGTWWSLGGREALLSSSDGYLRFSSDTKKGQSGGALFTEAWEMVGMPLVLGDRIVLARPIESIVDRLLQWNVPVKLALRALKDRVKGADEMAREQLAIATSRLLAARAEELMAQPGYPLPIGLDVAVHAATRFPTTEADTAMRRGLSMLAPLLASLSIRGDVIGGQVRGGKGKIAVLPVDPLNDSLPDEVAILEFPSGKELWRRPHARFNLKAAFSEDGERVALSETTKAVAVLRVNQGSVVWRRELTGIVEQVALSPDGRRLAVVYKPGDSAEQQSSLSAKPPTHVSEVIDVDLDKTLLHIDASSLWSFTGFNHRGDFASVTSGSDTQTVKIWPWWNDEFLPPVGGTFQRDISAVYSSNDIQFTDEAIISGGRRLQLGPGNSSRVAEEDPVLTRINRPFTLLPPQSGRAYGLAAISVGQDEALFWHLRRTAGQFMSLASTRAPLDSRGAGGWLVAWDGQIPAVMISQSKIDSKRTVQVSLWSTMTRSDPESPNWTVTGHLCPTGARAIRPVGTGLQILDMVNGQVRDTLSEDQFTGWNAGSIACDASADTITVDSLDWASLAKREGNDYPIGGWRSGNYLISSQRKDTLSNMTTSADGRFLAERALDYEQNQWYLRVVDLKANPLEKPVFEVASGPLESLYFNQDASMLAAIAQDALDVYSIREGKKLTVFKLGGSPLFRGVLAFSPNGSRMAFSDTRRIRVVDTSTWQEILPSIWITASDLAYSLDGQWLAAASGNQLRVWDAQTGVEVLHEPFLDDVTSIAFTPEGVLAALDTGTTARVALGTEELAKESCRRLGRDLTPTEWQIVIPDISYEPTCAETADHPIFAESIEQLMR